MLRKAFIGAALAFLCLLPVSSDDVRIITLEEAIRSAAEHNLDIEYAKTELSSTLRIQDNVMSTFMPEISLRASVSPAVNFPTSSGTAISYDGLTVSAGADVSFPFTGGMLNDGRDRSIAREEASPAKRHLDRDFGSSWKSATRSHPRRRRHALHRKGAEDSNMITERDYENILHLACEHGPKQEL